MMLLCWHWPADAAETPSSMTGSYAVITRGHLSGSGHAAVGAKSVTITIQVTDADGNSGTLVAPNLKMANNRFRGTGTAMGQPITISGRIDASGGALRAPRITCTYSIGQGKTGRIVGERRR
jgi:hypothetical protein